ncbi:GNAT family N-acetyltransferase [Kribbella sandramycini]|uniref:GNAT family N-acetyltransferase n=1 Tax=Kribbella sandramycini TaxID=60450 RepID=A0A7Y4KXZ9_9ACTN|nr:GNAT family N-acetyltransferase [Kribbella sandramycini]MBB6567663.1 putative GNAT superfamily acetyltransferase [Kribbella sandramycini]NOL39736.1 GNAT family N-acetyltransferase [Kribbella sandramycini]
MTADSKAPDAVLVPENWVREAKVLADDAAERAGVRIELATSHADCEAASRLFDQVWHDSESSVLTPGALIALAHSGNYVALVRVGDRVVGAAAGFFSPPRAQTLHSHIAGMLPELRGRGAGIALKLHQRHWALGVGATNITWTFDPLVARNAYLNVHRLGAEIECYFENFYGDMGDALNGHDDSDRALANWNLLRPYPRRPSVLDREPEYVLSRQGDRPQLQLPAGESNGPLTLQIPADIEGLRRTNPAAASAWRAGLRAALTWALADGWKVVDVRRDGCYLLERSGKSGGQRRS